MVSYKFSGHLDSNLFVRPKHKISVTQLWSWHLVPLIESHFPVQTVSQIKGNGNWDECLKALLDIGAVYLSQKRCQHEFDLDEASVLRIHLLPKRYNTDLFQWNKNVLFENEEWIVINKPALLPVHPTLDNAKENLLFLIQRNKTEIIHCVHRLDLETTGVMIFAKGAGSVSRLQILFSSQQGVRKYYKAILNGDGPNIGLYQHWMLPGKSAPKKIVDHPADGASIVTLTVQNKRKIQWENHNATLVDIELHTGRTHQIRAQMSHLGFPLISDVVYGGPFISKHFFLHCFRMQVTDSQGKIHEFNCKTNWE